jgi:MYXO-CTERM domain-containing protein
MKNQPATRRAFAALIPASLLLALPAAAQEVQPAPAPPVQTVTPPPVVPTIAPPAATVTPPPAVTPTVTAEPEATPPAPRVTTRTTRTITRATTRARVVRTPAPAPVRAAPAPAPVAVAPVPAPAEVTPAPIAQPPAEAAAPAPIAPEATTQSSTVTESAPLWPWALGALLLIAAIGFFVMRRRRANAEEAYYDEPYVETEAATAAPIRNEPAAFAPDPEPQFPRTAPLAAAPLVAAAAFSDEPAPVAAEEATLAKPEAEEVASLTEGTAPVADRPWLEFSLRPVRAGTNVDEALVEIELTVGNSGSVAARNVRISTFMFASGPAGDGDMERMLVERGEDGVPPVTIQPGEGTRVDATLALSKADLIESTNGSILPVVVADARYTLPDGSEGRTSASFTIGVSEEGGPAMSPIVLTERAMHDDVEARLHGVPEHA